ncbi:unnamed protein product [Symbiodinium sp. CCMP2592]|nr:unnamed protein product [Symbiodinium sp. CCMP2592]
MALKSSKKHDKEKKVKKEKKEKKEDKGSAAKGSAATAPANRPPAIRRLNLKTSPRSAKRKPLSQPAADPKPEKEEQKTEEPKAPKAPKASKQAPEQTKEPQSTENREKEQSAPKRAKKEVPEAPAVSPKDHPTALKDLKKQEKKARAKEEKKQKKQEKRDKKAKSEAEESVVKEDPPSAGEDSKKQASESETPAPRKNLLERFDTQDAEVNEEYLEKLLREMSESPGPINKSDDEESSGAESEGEDSEASSQGESSSEESSSRGCEEQSGNESDDKEAKSPTASSSSDTEDDEEEEAADGNSTKQSALVPVAKAEDAQPGTCLALVAAGAENATAGQANSTTNKREWDVFTRECHNRKKFPVELADYYEKSKTDMFNLVKVTVERMREKKTTARQGALAMKKRDIIKTYPGRGEELCKKLRSSGRFYRDEEFPSDSEEIFYYVRQPRKVNVDVIVGEKASMSGSMAVEDSAAMEQMTGQDGVFAAGALPAMKTDGAAGGKALAEVLVDEAIDKKKSKKKKTGETTEPVEPTTIKDQAEEMAKDMLKTSGDARKLSLSLQGLDMAGTLSKDLAAFSKECEKMFTEVQKRLRKKNHKKKDKKAFAEFVNVSKEKMDWWKQAEVAGKAFTSAANRKKKAKAKASGGKDGLLPFTFHCDGAEFYSNSEFMVWSCSSIFATGDVWDIKLPCVIVPHEFMADIDAVREHVHRHVAQLMAWSMDCAMQGKGPEVGFHGEKFENGSLRQKLAGSSIGAAFFSMKYDLKARVQCNFFTRHYGCNLVCESCFACKPGKNTEPLLTYRDFSLSAGHRLTRFGHRDYLALTPPEELSPWTAMKGLLPVAASLQESLRISFRRKFFTPSNTGLGTADYPELSTTWKAAEIKIVVWRFLLQWQFLAVHFHSLQKKRWKIRGILPRTSQEDRNPLLFASSDGKNFPTLAFAVGPEMATNT